MHSMQLIEIGVTALRRKLRPRCRNKLIEEADVAGCVLVDLIDARQVVARSEYYVHLPSPWLSEMAVMGAITASD